MKHVDHRLAAWVGGELSATEAAALEQHLAGCSECRGQASRMRAAWDALGCAALPSGPRRVDLWPQVRERTIGRAAGGWFFGRNPAVRLALAVATLAVGVLCGRLTGGLTGPRSAVADDGSLAAMWLEESTWHRDGGGGLADSWLAVAEDGTATSLVTDSGGTK